MTRSAGSGLTRIAVLLTALLACPVAAGPAGAREPHPGSHAIVDRATLDNETQAAAARAAPRSGIASHASGSGHSRTRDWPAGTVLLKFRNLEGAILLLASLRGGGRDTTGAMMLDTGAGYVALDRPLAVALGLVDPANPGSEIELSHRPIRQLRLGTFQVEDVSPILVIDGSVIRRVTDQPALGLIGQSILSDRVVVIDYPDESLALLPRTESAVLRRLFSSRAVVVPFRLEGDGKLLVEARVAKSDAHDFGPTLRLIVDTGATKTVFFEGSLTYSVPEARSWPRMRGLSAPTLLGSDAASMTRVPAIEIRGPTARVIEYGMDAALIESELEGMLSRVVNEPIVGLLGYSFLKHYRIAIDYPAHELWLDRIAADRDARPFEYSHVGVQIERVEGDARVVGVVTGSPADRAGIAVGDVVLAINGERAITRDILAASRRLEGRPGSRVTLTLRRGNRERTYSLIRRRLL
jgi:hypothetical protein